MQVYNENNTNWHKEQARSHGTSVVAERAQSVLQRDWAQERVYCEERAEDSFIVEQWVKEEAYRYPTARPSEQLLDLAELYAHFFTVLHRRQRSCSDCSLFQSTTEWW